MFPKSIFFIVSNEFCERFCYYGMRTVLFLYLIEVLRYPKETAVEIFHIFTMLAYFFPLIGGVVADSWLGKYRTIIYFSIVYVIGQILISISSVPLLHLPISEISLFGLFLIATGTGGIKPCIVSFGGEQFKLPEQEAQLSKYFTAFYVAISIGAFISSVVIPMLRKDVTCFGLNSCYPLAFLVPSILMILSLVIFIGGKRMYQIKKPEGNVLVKVIKCISHAIRRKLNSSEKRVHWLDYAEDVYDHKLINDTKLVLTVLKFFIPLTFFYSLFDQTASLWIYQGTRMDGEVFGYLIKPDQFTAFNLVLFVTTVILSDLVIYPFTDRFLCINTPLRKITTGCILAAVSYIISGLLEIRLESTYAVQPSPGMAQIRIFNTINCPVDLSLDGQNYKLEAFGLYQNLSISVTRNTSLHYDMNVKCPSTLPLTIAGSIVVEEERALSYLLRSDGIGIYLSDKIDKSENGDPMVRTLMLTESGAPANLSLRLEGSETYHLKQQEDKFFTSFVEVKHNIYNISVNSVQISRDVPLRSGGVYTIVGRFSSDGTVDINILTVVEPNSINMLWLLPQYITMTVGEVMFFVTGLKFAYTEAPSSMKSVVQAFWLFNSAIGNLFVVVITALHFFNRQAYAFFMYAAVMFVDMIFFIIMTLSYKYVDNSSNDNFIKGDTNKCNGGY